MPRVEQLHVDQSLDIRAIIEVAKAHGEMNAGFCLIAEARERFMNDHTALPDLLTAVRSALIGIGWIAQGEP